MTETAKQPMIVLKQKSGESADAFRARVAEADRAAAEKAVIYVVPAADASVKASAPPLG